MLKFYFFLKTDNTITTSATYQLSKPRLGHRDFDIALIINLVSKLERIHKWLIHFHCRGAAIAGH
jgi:hypothetical protein